MAARLLGPTLRATLCTPSLERSIKAWEGSLHQHVHTRGQLDAVRATLLNAPGMAGAPFALLANELDEPWLELIENPATKALDPFAHSGWFSLEICVADVDALRPTIDESLFKVIGEPANLEMSDNIRAMQVIGPAGEVLYLTEIKAPVPPFDLPTARCVVDRLFIPVILASDRSETAAVYEQLNGQDGMKFDTRITVINRARGLEISTQHPVCAQQLAGSNLIEIDQLDSLQTRKGTGDNLPSGIIAITFAVETLPEDHPGQVIRGGLFAGRKTACLRGEAGEWIELIE